MGFGRIVAVLGVLAVGLNGVVGEDVGKLSALLPQALLAVSSGDGKRQQDVLKKVADLYTATEKSLEQEEKEGDVDIRSLEGEIRVLDDKLVAAKTALAALAQSSGVPEIEAELCQKVVDAKQRRSRSYKTLPALVGKIATAKEAFKHMIADDDLNSINLYLRGTSEAVAEMQNTDKVLEECEDFLDHRKEAQAQTRKNGVQDQIKAAGATVAELTQAKDLKTQRLGAVHADLSSRVGSLKTKLSTIEGVLNMLKQHPATPSAPASAEEAGSEE